MRREKKQKAISKENANPISLTNATRVAALLSAAQVQMILPLSPHDGVPHLLTAHTEHRVLLRRGRDESSRRGVKLG